MAKLVGVPCGVAVQFILEGVLTKPGVLQPYDEEVSSVLLELQLLLVLRRVVGVMFVGTDDPGRRASCSGTGSKPRRASRWSRSASRRGRSKSSCRSGNDASL